MFTSFADCGMTSNPTNRNGTTTSTAKKPAVPPVKSGAMLSVEPPVKEPKTSVEAGKEVKGGSGESHRLERHDGHVAADDAPRADERPLGAHAREAGSCARRRLWAWPP